MLLSNISKEEVESLSLRKKWDFNCAGIKDDGKSADLAILLGTRPEKALERALAAAELYKSGRVKYIIPSGGVKWDHEGENISEADYMERILIENGVPASVIFKDNEARTTKENMICSTLTLNRTLRLGAVNSIIIVTSLVHMKRSLLLANALLPRKFEISGYPSPIKVSKEEWLSDEYNVRVLNSSVSLIKGLVDEHIVEDVDIEI